MLPSYPPAAAEPTQGDSSKKLNPHATAPPAPMVRSSRANGRSSCREDCGSTAPTVEPGRPVGRPRTQVGSTVQGKVKFFNHDRGFGFISREVGDDVFVHVSSLQADGTTLTEGQTVEFEIGPGRKSEEAKNVRSA